MQKIGYLMFCRNPNSKMSWKILEMRDRLILIGIDYPWNFRRAGPMPSMPRSRLDVVWLLF